MVELNAVSDATGSAVLYFHDGPRTVRFKPAALEHQIGEEDARRPERNANSPNTNRGTCKLTSPRRHPLLCLDR